MRTNFVLMLLAASFVAVGSLPANAASISPGSILVYRVGNGTSGSISANGSPVFVDEYNSSGTLLQSIAMPTTASGSQKQLISGGTTAEGMLTISPDGQYVALTGYAANLGGSTSLSSTAATAVNRTVGIITVSTGGVDTSTALSDLANSNVVRTAVTVDGSAVWAGAGNNPIRYATLGASTGTSISSTAPRNMNIFDGQLYISDATNGIRTVGTGLPTTSTSLAQLPGAPGVGSPYGFFFADLDAGVPGVDTLYVASDNANALQKFSLVGGMWTLNGTVGTDQDYRGLTGAVNGSSVTLYAARNQDNTLVTLVDSSGYNGAFTGTPSVLVTGLANTAFRGVAFVPVPEPSAIFLASIALIGMGTAGRRKKKSVY